MTKEKVIIAIKDLPEEFHLDELFERLVFIEDIEAARKEVREGKTIPHEEVKKNIESWRK